MDILFTIGSVLFGGFFVMNGMMHFMKFNNMVEYSRMKGVPSPRFSVIITGAVIVLAGLGVIFNYYREESFLAIAIFLGVIPPVMHAYWRIPQEMRMVEMQMFLKNMALLGAALALFALSM